MDIVILTAIGVGGATVIGSLIGFVFRNLSHKFSDIILAFAAGVMLAAAVLGLVMPSLELGGDYGIIVTVAGIFTGAILMKVVDKLVPHLHNLGKGKEGFAEVGEEVKREKTKIDKAMLFVLAIAIHNLPEGIAAGVGFGGGDTMGALFIAGGIALQNIPEGMVIIAPMLAAGIKPGKAFLYGALTGAVEILGTFIGYFAISIAGAILPFSLAFAGGTMLYVISDEMIPETHAHGSESGATFALLAGFCLMLVMDVLLA